METILEKSGIKGRVRIITKKAGTEEVLAVSEWTDNLVVRGTDTGMDLILDRLNGTNTYSLNIGYADIGTSATAVTIADVALNAGAVRGAKAYGSISANVLTLQFFYPDSVLSNTTFREFGCFVDGTSTAGTGQMFNHVLFASAYTKTSGTDTTVEVQFTIT